MAHLVLEEEEDVGEPERGSGARWPSRTSGSRGSRRKEKSLTKRVEGVAADGGFGAPPGDGAVGS